MKNKKNKAFSFFDLSVNVDSKIVKKDDFTKALDVESFYNLVKQKSVEYKQGVVKECELIKKKASDEGFAEGLESVLKHTVSVDKVLESYKKEMSSKIVDFAISVSEKIVSESLKMNPEFIEHIVKDALKDITQRNKVEIHLNESDIPRVNEAEIKSMLHQVEIFLIKPDKKLQPGECKIYTGQEIIEVTFPVLFDKLKNVARDFVRTA